VSPSPRSARRATLAALLGLGLMLGAAPGSGLDSWELLWAGTRSPLPVAQTAEGPLFSLEALASALGLHMERLDRKSAVLRLESGGRLLCGAGRSVVLVGEEVLLLSRPPDLRRGRIFVPEDFVERALGRLLGREIRTRAGAGVLELAEAAALRARWRLDGARADLLLDLRGRTEAAGLQIRRQGDGLSLDVPVSVEPPQEPSPRFGVLEVRPQGTGGSRLHLRPAPGYVALPSLEGGVLRVSLVSREEIQGPPREGSREETAAAGTLSADPDAALFGLVVLDPGHGGGETGAVGKGGLQEKDLVLRIAWILARILEEDGIETALTREGDEEMPLDDRTAFANQLRASLFVSLHANASMVPAALGSETFFLSREATDEMSRKVAAIESNTIGVRGRSRRRAPGALEMTLWEMAQAQFLQESQRLAERIQAELNEVAGTPDRGVKQAPFTVLMGATMPAVLVEVGFLSNPAEERKLRDPGHLERIARAIARAVRSFGEERLRRAGQGGAE